MTPALAAALGVVVGAVFATIATYVATRIRLAAPPPDTGPERQRVLDALRAGAVLVGDQDEILGANTVASDIGLVRGERVAIPALLELVREVRRDGETATVNLDQTRSGRPGQRLAVRVVRLDDGTGECELRFFSFYPSHQKTMAVGERIRARGEVKGGFWGRQMLHPVFRKAEGELPAALTPVYPTVAQLPQAYLRRAVASGLRRAELSETLGPHLPPAPVALREIAQTREGLVAVAARVEEVDGLAARDAVACGGDVDAHLVLGHHVGRLEHVVP